MAAVFEKILEMSLTAAVVIVVVLVIRLLLRRAPKKYSYALWSVAAFRLVCPVSFKAVFSLFTFANRLEETQIQFPVTDPLPATSPGYFDSVVPGSSAPYIDFDPDYAFTYPLTAPAAERTADLLEQAMKIAAVVWLVGMAALLIYGIVSYVRLRRRMSTAVLLEDNIWQSDRVQSPFILGFVRPKIYLPFGLSGEQQSYVLAHERYHLKRFDHIIRPLSFLILAVHWLNPFVWLAYYLMARDMEMSCDEKVLSTEENIRKAYSTTLLSFAANRRFPSPSPLAFGESGVKGRIKNALNWKKPRTWVTVIAIVVCIVVIVVCAANPKEPDNSPAIYDVTSTVTADELGFALCSDGSVTVCLNSEEKGQLAKLLNQLSEADFEGTYLYSEVSLNSELNITFPWGSLCRTEGQLYLGMIDSEGGSVNDYLFWQVNSIGLGQFIDGLTLAHGTVEPMEPATQPEENAPTTLATWTLNDLTLTVLEGDSDAWRYTIDVCDANNYYFWSTSFDRLADNLMYFRYEENGVQYLMELNGSGGQGIGVWDYRIFSIGPESINVIRENSLYYEATSVETVLAVDVEAIRAFEAEVNALLEHAELIAGIENNQFIYNANPGKEYVYHWSIGMIETIEESQNYWRTKEEVLAVWQADLTHDGVDETITLTGSNWHETLSHWTHFTVTVTDTAGKTLWADEADSSHVGWNGIYLCRRDGKAYLMNWVPYGSTGIFDLRYSVFSLTNSGGVRVLAENELSYGTIATELMTLDVADIRAFENEVNALLADSIVLFSNTNKGIATYSTEGNVITEQFSGYADSAELYQADFFGESPSAYFLTYSTNTDVEAYAMEQAARLLAESGITSGAAAVLGIEDIDTATVGLTNGWYIYRMRYQLTAYDKAAGLTEEQPMAHIYLCLYSEWSGGSRVWEPMGTLTEEKLQQYNTPEMEAMYGGDDLWLYRAAISQTYQNWKEN